MSEPTPPYTDEQLKSDDVSKKELCTFLQENGSRKFLKENKLNGQLKSIAKTKSKDQLVADYHLLFETKDFKKEGEEEEDEVKKVVKATEKLSVKPKKEEVVEEAPKYTKRIMKKGDKINFPSKGSTVDCWYTGKLDNGEVFDSNEINLKRAKKHQPLQFKVGMGNVIKGWDHALLHMSAGERCEIVIEPEWAYGKKGCEPKIPANARLTFEVELARIY